MATQNPKEHIIDEDGTIILCSNHLGKVVEVHMNRETRRFYGIKKDGTVIEHDRYCGTNFTRPHMLYKTHYYFKQDTWVVGYRLKNQDEDKWKAGFKTAREAWLYREALIADNKAEK